MVYLTRSTTFTGDWQKGWQTLMDVSRYCEDAYPEVKESFLMTNIAGPTDQVHWVHGFEGLSEEDSFSHKPFQDEKYMSSMMSLDGIVTAPIDKLYRRET